MKRSNLKLLKTLNKLTVHGIESIILETFTLWSRKALIERYLSDVNIRTASRHVVFEMFIRR